MQPDSSNKTTLYLIRHAEAYNPKRIIYVWLPRFGLSKLGYFQAHKLADYFQTHKIDKIYASPLLRARKTAEIISDGKMQVHLRRSFIEICFKKWQGLTFEEKMIKEVEDHIKSAGKTNSLGESVEDCQNRMLKGISQIVKENTGKSIAIVSHADPIILAILHFQKEKVSELNNREVPNGSIYKLVFNKNLECEKIEYIQVAPAKKDWA